MRSVFADLHVHIGRSANGTPIKISGSRDLTFQNIAFEASERKGIELIGVIDCHSPAVQEDIQACLESGEMEELATGGIRYRNTTILLGSEIEVRDPGCGPAHLLAFLPHFAMMQEFTLWLKRWMKNPVLSSQRIYTTAKQLQQEVYDRGGIMIPAHVFTPHRSVYGSSVDQMATLLNLDQVAGVELGLSSDTEMASYLPELDPIPFVTNSDAHSLAKIGREYNRIVMEEPSFSELVMALERKEGRYIAMNYGLNPQLGKYYRTYCSGCQSILDEEAITTSRCGLCGSTKIVRGVLDRIQDLAERDSPLVPPWKPPYVYQVPLEFIPGLGKKTIQLLLDRFGTEMNIIHRVNEADLVAFAGNKTANYIMQARAGQLQIGAGGGGKYGKVN